jgi:poly(3-hydroxybutyrate) depolymerase
VLFPPAGFSRNAAERFYKMTQSATASGYIVVLSDALPLSSHAMRAQADVVVEVAERWCVDTERVVLAGHSDGGLMAQGTVIKSQLPATLNVHVVSSAAGIQQPDLASEHCPSPRRVTLLHPANDERFPGYGWGVAQWWANCFSCQTNMAEPAPGQCADAQGCSTSSSVRFCKTATSHAQYPPELGVQLRQLMQRLPRS